MATLTRKKIQVLWASWLTIALMVSASAVAAATSDPNKTPKESTSSYRIHSVNWEQSSADYILSIKGGSTPTYTMYELFEPLRVIIDIADASIDPAVSLPIELQQSPVSVINGKTISDKKPSFTRIELFLRKDHNYTVERIDNDIIVKFPQTQTQQAEIPSELANEKQLSKVSEPGDGLLATKLVNIEISKSATETKIYLKTDGAIRNFKKVLLGKNAAANRPDRMYIDLNNIRLIGATETISVDTSLAKVRTAKRQDGIRIVFDSGIDKLFDYSINKQSDGLLVTIKEPSSANDIMSNLVNSDDKISPQTAHHSENNAATTAPSETDIEVVAEPTKPPVLTTTVLDENNIDEIASKDPNKTFKAPSPRDLTFAGYTKQRITVDFYKIDLHNVFRLFGDISNLNIVVDEAVSGSLTLALNDVPWDFALDIILNLKDLQKEERFNTIVISPKSKSFTWPERALDNVEFKSDIKIEQAEQDPGGLKISKRLEVPETVIEAKKLIHQANAIERKGDYAGSLPLYEEAFSKWSDNANLARKIAAMCLVNLEQNAKAVHYAKTVLKLSPGDHDAALHAGIGLARMKKDTEAKEMFELSVSGPKPPSEALISYSSFCEEQLNYDCALSHLSRHENLYGDTLPTMISKARLYDKQGNQSQAAQEYQTILLSGFELPPDLARYIKGRAALSGAK